MPELSAPRLTTAWRVGLRYAGIAALVALLLAFGTYDEPLFALLTASWQAVLGKLGITGPLAAARHGVDARLTTRSLPAMLTYGLLYTGACLALLRLLLPAPAWRQALLVYGAVFAVCALLLLGGWAAGHAVWPYRVGRQLIDFIVSPLPVVGLLPLLGRPRKAVQP